MMSHLRNKPTHCNISLHFTLEVDRHTFITSIVSCFFIHTSLHSNILSPLYSPLLLSSLNTQHTIQSPFKQEIPHGMSIINTHSQRERILPSSSGLLISLSISISLYAHSSLSSGAFLSCSAEWNATMDEGEKRCGRDVNTSPSSFTRLSLHFSLLDVCLSLLSTTLLFTPT